MKEKKYSEKDVNRLYDAAETYLIRRWEPRPGFKPLILVGGEGVYFQDVNGKRYLDFISQLYNVHVGLGNREIIDAAKNQLDEMAYSSPSYFNVPQIQLARRLSEITPDDLCKTFFSNSGAEANETAIKLAQLYRGAEKIVGFWDAYHGSTYATISVGGSARNRHHPGLSIFEEFKHVPPPYCYRCPFNKTYPDCSLLCADFIEYTIEKEGENSVAAFMAEPICSWAGQVVPPDGYWEKVRKICDEKEIVLIFDEVMTAFARTGKMFACEHWNINPDIETYAKGITSGYVPLGATIVNEKIGEHFSQKGFPHSYTYSGHALACATAMAVIDFYLNEKLADKARLLGDYMLDELKGIQERQPIIGDIRGLGLFIGIELVANPQTKEKIVPQKLTSDQKRDPEKNPMIYLADKAKENGLIIGSSPGTGIVRMMPYLIISKEQIDEGLKLLENTLDEVAKKFSLPRKK